MKKMKEIDLTKTFPATFVLSVALCYLIDGHAQGRLLGLTVGAAVSPFITALFYLFVRVGWLPWFEMKDGRRHRLILWLERKIVFLRADFYRK